MTGRALATARTGAELDVFTGTDPATVAKAFKASGMFPDLASEAQAFVKIIAGRELGIGPMAAISGLNVIKGRATPSANLLATLVKTHPAYDYIPREVTAEKARIEFFQNGDSIGVSEFTIQEARQAGLNGQNWKAYPKAMLFARALSQGVRWFCPDVTAGSPAYVPEEMGAVVDAEGGVVQSPESNPQVEGEAVPWDDSPEAESVEGEVVESVDDARVARITAGFHALGLNIGQIAGLFGAAGLDGLRARSKKAVIERLEALTPADADLLEVEMGRMADRGE